MTLANVGDAWLTIRADTSQVGGEIESGIQGDLSATDLGATGELAGADLAGGVRKGAEKDLEGLGDDADAAGKDVGTKLEEGASGILSGLGTFFSSVFSKAKGAVETAAGGMSDALDGVGKHASSLAGSIGGPLATAVDKGGKAMDKTKASGDGLVSSLSNIGGKLALGATVGFLAFSAASIKSAADFQGTVTSIAANAGISVTAAKKIGTAFLDTAGKTIYSGQTIGQAYAGVAAQLGQAEGHALSAATATKVMSAAMDLAEGSGTQLKTATSALSTVMQVYSLKATTATQASDALFQTGRLTGQGMTSIAKSLQRLHSQLGSVTPSIGQAGALMVDLANHGETGRQAMSGMSSAMTSLLKPVNTVNKQVQTQTSLLGAMTPALQTIAKQYASGALTSAQYTAATKTLTQTQARLASAFKTSATAQAKAQQTLTALGLTLTTATGKFVGMTSVITQLHAKIAGMTTAQAKATLSTIFGTKAASQLLDTIKAGPAAYDKATDSVTKAGSAHDAAAKQAGTLGHQLDVLKTTIEDDAVKWGQILIPVLEKVVKAFLDVGNWIIDNKPVLIALGVVVGGVLAAAFIAWAAGMLVAAADAALMLLAIAPIILIVAAIGAAVYELYTNWTTVWSAIKSVFDTVWTAIKTVFNDVINFFTNSTIGQIIMTVLLGPIPEIIKHWNTIVTFFEKIPGKIEAFFTGAADWLIDIGKKIIDGLWSGIKDGIKDAENVVKSVGSHVVNAFKDVFSIFSPSKVTTQIGQTVAAGLTKGITAGSQETIKAATAAAKAILKAFGGLTSLKTKTAAITAVEKLLTGVKKVLGDLTKISTSGAKITFQKVLAAFSQVTAIIPALSKLGTALKGVSKTIDAFKSHIAPLETVMTKLSKIGTAFVKIQNDFKKVNFTTVIQDFKNLAKAAPELSWAISTISISFGKLKTLNQTAAKLKAVETVFKKIDTILKKFVTTTKLAGKVKFTTLIQAFKDLAKAAPTLDDSLNTISESFGKLKTLDQISGKLKTLETVFTDFSKLLSGLAKVTHQLAGMTIPKDFTTLEKAASSMATGLAATFAALHTNTTTQWNAIKTYVKSVDTDVVTPLKDLAAKVTAVAVTLKKVWAKVDKDLRTTWKDVLTFVTALPTELTAPFAKLATTFHDLGVDLMKGLAAGIAAGQSQAVNAAAAAGRAAVAATKTATTSTSPSKAFYRIGDENLMLGLAEGIKAGATARVLPEVDSLSNKLLGGIAKGGIGSAPSAPSAGSTQQGAGNTYVTVGPTAVKITVGDTEQASAARDGATQGMITLGRELGAGTAPLRIG